VDLSKLSTGDKVIGISAIVYLIAMFLPWYGIDVNAGTFSQSYNNTGWSYFLGGIIPLILILLVVAKIAISKFSPQTKLPDLPIPWSQAVLGAAVAAAVIVLLRLAIGSDKVGSISTGLSLDRKIGLFVAAIAAIGVAAGAFMKYQAHEEDDAISGGGSVPPTSF
jgi:hypothetical protein